MRFKKMRDQNLPPPRSGTPSLSSTFFTALKGILSAPIMRNTRRTTHISSSLIT
jgi:hypothetical protein